MSRTKASSSKPVLFHGPPSNTIGEPLLFVAHGDHHHQEEDDAVLERLNNETAVMFSSFKMSALFMGVLIGFLIQLSTLGANYLVMTIWGNNNILTKSNQDITNFAILWSFFTSVMAIIMLALLRNIVVSIAYMSVSKSQQAMMVIMDEMILHIECNFVFGCLIGVCTAWAVTDALVGLETQILYSIATLGVALTWCRVMVTCLRSSGETTKSDDPTRHEVVVII